MKINFYFKLSEYVKYTKLLNYDIQSYNFYSFQLIYSF